MCADALHHIGPSTLPTPTVSPGSSLRFDSWGQSHYEQKSVYKTIYHFNIFMNSFMFSYTFKKGNLCFLCDIAIYLCLVSFLFLRATTLDI